MGSTTATTEHRAAMLVNILLILLPAITISSPTVLSGRNLSRFQVAVQHCCSSKTSKTPHRCFELNEFSGINFVSSPCRFLKTLEKTFSAEEPSDQIVFSDLKPGPSITRVTSRVFSGDDPAEQIVNKSAGPEQETKEKFMSTFQTAVQNCCSDKNSNTAYRCFEVNGVEGVNFVEKPCMFLRTLKNMLEEAAE